MVSQSMNSKRMNMEIAGPRRAMIPMLAATLLALLASFIAPATRADELFQLPLKELEARYAAPTSRFMDIDGVRVHYIDEGSGPAVVLIHASFMNLRTWDSLAASLRGSHRVIRLDMLMAGLTGPDPKDRYSMEHNLELVERLTAALGVKEFALLGTSSGGIVAFRYAAAHPEQVRRLILVNSAGMPRTPVTDPNRARGSAWSRWWRSLHRSRGSWLEDLRHQFSSGVEPAASFVDMVYDMNRRAGLREEGGKFMRNFRTGDPEATLAKVKAPTLVLWGMGNITVDHLQADVFEHWLTGAPSLKKKYPKVGHYMYVEAPAEFERDVAAFLDGQLDAQLRTTVRQAGTVTGTGT
jgi:pimeloyl-ACP methyl ester carboxylesterase